MRRFGWLALVTCALMVSSSVAEAKTRKKKAGIEILATPALALPLSSRWDKQGIIGLGATLDVLYPLQDAFSLTGRIGYTYFLPESTTIGAVETEQGSSVLPILAGIQLDLSEMLFLTGELGVSFNKSWAKVAGVSREADNTGLAFAIGAGYDLGPAAVTFRVFATDWRDDEFQLEWAGFLGIQIPITVL